MAKKKSKRQPSKLRVDVIETQAIVLIDEYGNERATVSSSGGSGGKGGFTVIQINDDGGRPRLELQVDPHGNPSIRLSTPNDGSGISMSVNDGIGNGISIGDCEGKPCITIGMPHPKSNDPRGTHPEITVTDELGRRGWSVFGGTYELPDNGEQAEN